MSERTSDGGSSVALRAYPGVISYTIGPGAESVPVPPLLMGVLLPLVHNVEGMLWLTGIIVATQYGRLWLQSPAAGKATDRITGVVIVAFAAKIAASKA